MKLKQKLDSFIDELKKEILAGNYEVNYTGKHLSNFSFGEVDILMWISNGSNHFGPFYEFNDHTILGDRHNWFGDDKEKAWEVYKAKVYPMEKSIRENKIKKLYNEIETLENENGNL